MPISPAELKRKVEKTISNQFEDFCRKIDNALEDASARYTIDRISVNIDTNGIHPTVLEKAIESYRTVGWEVNHVSDQRDGDYLSIKYQKSVTKLDRYIKA